MCWLAEGDTVLIVEKNVQSALPTSDDAVALKSGYCVWHKSAFKLLADPNIERLFLGGHAAVTS